MKNILFVSSEAVPYIKTGGLADVVGSLPRYFNREEYDVRVILPKYACLDSELAKNLKFVCHFYLHLNWRKQYVGIFESEYAGIKYYFVDNEFYFAGPNPYNNIFEDVEKFAYFSKAVLAALPYIDFLPNVIHCNDWQTGLLPVFLKTSFGSDDFYSQIKTIFSIHNMKFQGRWKLKEIEDITGLPEHIFTPKGIESYGEANYLKGGIVYSDYVTTVSPTYAHDITTPEGGEGLDGLMREKEDRLFGIVNGIDYDEFNPATDPFIPSKFSVDDYDFTERKKVNKRAFQDKYGLDSRDDVMLVGIVSRMTDQKGFDLVAYVMDEILSTLNVQFAILGTGEEKYQNMFKHFERKYSGRVHTNIGYSDELAHEIYASADAFLMPSLFEPCGLSQMMSMRYGTVPIVRETGGLKDTVEPYNMYENSGDGFSFSEYNHCDLMYVFKLALSVFNEEKQRWIDIQRRGMIKDFSWNSSARQYEKLYDELLKIDD